MIFESVCVQLEEVETSCTVYTFSSRTCVCVFSRFAKWLTSRCDLYGSLFFLVFVHFYCFDLNLLVLTKVSNNVEHWCFSVWKCIIPFRCRYGRCDLLVMQTGRYASCAFWVHLVIRRFEFFGYMFLPLHLSIQYIVLFMKYLKSSNGRQPNWRKPPGMLILALPVERC